MIKKKCTRREAVEIFEPIHINSMTEKNRLRYTNSAYTREDPERHVKRWRYELERPGPNPVLYKERDDDITARHDLDPIRSFSKKGTITSRIGTTWTRSRPFRCLFFYFMKETGVDTHLLLIIPVCIKNRRIAPSELQINPHGFTIFWAHSELRLCT